VTLQVGPTSKQNGCKPVSGGTRHQNRFNIREDCTHSSAQMAILVLASVGSV